MAELIKLNNILSFENKNVITGLASGGDTKALIDASVTTKRIPIDILQTKLDKRVEQISEFETLRIHLNNLREAANALRTPPIFAGDAVKNIFKNRKVQMTSSIPATLPSDVLKVTAKPGAGLAEYTIENITIAQSKQQRSDFTFTSETDSITDAAATNNANQFSAGTFQVTSRELYQKIETKDSPITASDISFTGAVGITALDNTYGTNGIDNIVVSGTDGDKGLTGSLSSMLTKTTATQTSTGNPVTLTLTINGKSYVSGLIPANTGGSNDEIASNSLITFTESTTNTSFQVRTGAGAITIANATDLSTFQANVKTDLSAITFFQNRELGNLNEVNATGTILDGLLNTHVKLNSDAYLHSDDTHGIMKQFFVQNDGAAPGDTGIMRVMIDDEIYENIALPATVNTAITLTSTTTSKTITFDFATAGISLDLTNGTGDATTIQRDLNYVFGTGMNITLQEGDSLTRVAAAINANSTQSGINATVLKVSDSAFRLILNSNKTGMDVNNTGDFPNFSYDFVDPEDVFTSTVTFTQSQAPLNAQFDIDTITVTRESNVITDVVNNLTIELLKDENTAAFTTEIMTDDVGAKDAIQTLVDRYNDFIDFYETQNNVTTVEKFNSSTGKYETEASKSEPLANSTLLESLKSLLTTEVTRIIPGITSSDPDSLPDIGIRLVESSKTESGSLVLSSKLTIDDLTLDPLLSADISDVSDVFGFNLQTNSSKLAVFSRTNALAISAFTLDIDISRPTGTEVQISYTDSLGAPQSITADFTLNALGTGGKIVGQDDTVLEGLVLAYNGDGTDIISVTATQGFADRVFNIMESSLIVDGSIDKEIESITTQIKRDQTRLTQMEESVIQFRKSLINKFSALEAAVAKVNAILTFLDTFQKERLK